MTKEIRKVTRKEFEFLKKLKIKLKHDVPKQHKIGKCSIYLTTEETNKFNKYCTLKKGKYLPEETAIIQKNWEDFCKVHNWDPDFPAPFVRMEYKSNNFYLPKKETRMKFYQFLANGLLWRSIPSVCYYFRVMYDESAKKSFSKNDDQIILKQMAELKTDDLEQKFLKIGEMLGKQPEAIARRYDVLMTSYPSYDHRVQRRVIWDLKLMTKFLKHLLELTLCNDVKQLKNAQIPKYVFKKIEDRMNINMTDLEKLWWVDMHLQLFSPKRIFINDLKIQLIKLMVKLGPKIVKSRPYETLSLFFDGTTPGFIEYFYKNALENGKIRQKGKLEDRLKHLYKYNIPKFKLSNKNSYKCRLQYYGGKIRLHPDDENNMDSCDEDNSGFSDIELSAEDGCEDAAVGVDVGVTKSRSNSIDARLSEESDSDRGSLNSNESTDTEHENAARGKIPSIEMWDDVVNGQIDNTKSLKKVDAKSVEFCSTFVTNLLDLTLSSSIEKLKNATIPGIIWKKLELKLNIPKDQLKDFWVLQLHMQLFCPKPMYLNEIKSQLIELLYELKLSTFADIQWPSLVYCFDGATPEFLQQVFDSVLASINDKDIKTKSFPYILKQIYMNEIRELTKANGDKRMKRFCYKIEKIKLIPV